MLASEHGSGLERATNLTLKPLSLNPPQGGGGGGAVPSQLLDLFPAFKSEADFPNEIISKVSPHFYKIIFI